ncbi:MAG: hypothetical protein M3460_07865 [Actinomycetota bacterium]|nr:hypothetical protein [Actinomycetota bacterium]
MLFGSIQQGLAFVGTFVGQQRVAAADQPFPGIVRVVISARLWVSNNDICSGPSSAARAAMAGARSAVIQSMPSSAARSLIRVLVIIPRSTTMVRFRTPN